MISYKPFYTTIAKKRVTQYQLVNIFLVPAGTIQRIRENKSITLKSLEQLCKVLNCNISDVVCFI
ncbi:MAG: helix-turn-helix domain-containing protein [Lachnospiraceae bacterium]|nr:helix-turn-helix domain-containing protein [Lachnospiraceae bacterium]